MPKKWKEIYEMHRRHCAMSRISIVVAVLLSASTARGDDIGDYCGDPPPVADETLKGEIKGQAQLLSRFLGAADLSGEIETSRKEIFSRYPEAERSRSNAFFEYQVCVHLMRDEDLSTREKINELILIRQEFSKPITSISDENDLFRTNIVSASKSSDGRNLTISAKLESKSADDFLMYYMSQTANAIDNDGTAYRYISISGMSRYASCNEFSNPSLFNLITPNSRQNLVFTFKSKSPGFGDRVHFSSNFCVISNDRVFRLPVGVSNIKLDSALPSTGRSQAPTTISCTSSVGLKSNEWAEFRKTSSTFGWHINVADHPCLIIHSDTDGGKRGCPGQHVSIGANERLWFRADSGVIQKDAVCFEGLQFVRYCRNCE